MMAHPVLLDNLVVVKLRKSLKNKVIGENRNLHACLTGEKREQLDISQREINSFLARKVQT